MTDKELLELAAKAAGINVHYVETQYERAFKVRYEIENTKGWRYWDPLTDDGDALRLAVKIGALIDIRYTDPMSSKYNNVTYWPTPHKGEQVRFCDRDADPCAATRRAIVRAAAEIGLQHK